MQLVEQHRIDRHDARFAAIDAAAFASKHLSNAALYRTRQAFIHERRVISDEELARDMKTSAEYRALPAKVAQWVLRQVALAWTSSFAACAAWEAWEAWEADPSRFLGHPQLPKYLPKQGRNLLTYPEQATSRAPMNRGYVVPSGLDIRVETRQTSIDQVRIVPHASQSTLQVIDARLITPADLAPTRLAAVDIGVNTLAAVPSNQWYNQRRARLHAKLPHGQFTSHRLDTLADKRGRHITGYLRVASRRIVEWLVNHRVGTLVVGKNDGCKHASRLGKRTNQNFVVVPHARFITMLRYKAALVGIHVVVSEESYTSKCSSLDLEPVGKRDVYAGKRIKRGLFPAAGGRRLNADVNGAYNILRKGVPDALGNGRGGVVAHPVRIALAHGPHGSHVHVA